MADRVTDIISKTTANGKSTTAEDSLKQTFIKSVSKNIDSDTQQKKEDIEKNNKGDSYSKKVENAGKDAKDTVQNTMSPYLKNRTKVIVAKLFSYDPDIQKAKNEAYDKYIDEFVSKTCEQIDTDVKTLEEYRSVAESIIRSSHNTINNDPEFQKEINKQLLTALQDSVIEETMNLINSQQINNIVLKSDLYITNVGNMATNIFNSTKFLTSMQVDDLITAYSKNASKNIANSISANTFGKLTKLPIIGSCFKKLETASNNMIQEGVQKIIEKKMTTQWVNTIANIKALQSATEKLQQEANTAIQKAEQEAKSYMQQFEQHAIDEIKKFINLDNLSIGGFKL